MQRGLAEGLQGQWLKLLGPLLQQGLGAQLEAQQALEERPGRARACVVGEHRATLPGRRRVRSAKMRKRQQ